MSSSISRAKVYLISACCPLSAPAVNRLLRLPTNSADFNLFTLACPQSLLSTLWTRQPPREAAIFYSTNITGGNTHTVVVQFSDPASYLALGVHEYSGIANVSPLDGTSGSLGNGTSLSSGAITTTADGDLIFGVGVEDSAGSGDTFTAGSGFAMRVDLGSAGAYADEDMVQTSAGSVAASWTLSPSGLDSITQVAAFKAATGAPGPTIASVSPMQGPAGTVVTITGTNFGSTEGSSTVTFNGTLSSPTSWSGTQIVVPVPTGATSGNIVVTVADAASNVVFFTVSTIRHVQQASNGDSSGTSYSSFSAAFPSAATSGNAIVFGLTYGNTNPTITATDSQGDTFTEAIRTWDPGHNAGCAIFYATNIHGGASNTVTVNFGDSVAYLALGIHEYTGIAASSPLDGTAGTTGGGASISSGSAATTANGDLVFGCAVEDSNGGGDTYTAGLGFTKRVDLGMDVGYADEDRIQPSAGSIASTWTISPDGFGWIANMAAFKTSGSGSGGTGPTISALSPTTGPAGTSVTITGSNFGASQGSSTVAFNGTAAAPASWSATSITASVPTGATTGNVVVTVGGIASNAANFTVTTGGTAPSISASVSPTPTAYGWNNSDVTISFTCTAGSAPITDCSAPQSVTLEGANQVVHGAATDANGLTATTTVTINMDKTVPSLTVTSPSDGATFSNAAITVSGTASDALSGVSAITCNATAATVAGGSFSCNISLTVGVNLIVVRVTDLAGNVSASNFHVSLTGSLPAPSSLEITPAGVNMVVGETREFTASDEHGRPRTDATWTSSDESIASFSSTDSPSLLTAVGTGQVTLTATLGSVSAQVQVTVVSGASLPPGTVRWSVPSTPGFSIAQVVQAVPTADGPAQYTVEFNNNAVLVKALGSEGQKMWQNQFDGFIFSSDDHALSDGKGGLFLRMDYQTGSFTYARRVVHLDTQTGQILWQYDDANPELFNITPKAVDLDGNVFLVERTDHIWPFPLGFAESHALIKIDGNTGALLFRYAGPTSTNTLHYTCNGNDLTQSYTAGPGAVSIGTDGTLYGTAFATAQVYSNDCDPNTWWYQSLPFSASQTLSLLTIPPGGTPAVTTIQTASGFNADGSLKLGGGPPIPDGQGSILMPWSMASSYTQVERHLMKFSGSGQTNITAPTLGALTLGDNGVAFSGDLTHVVSFNVDTGQTLWTYQVPDLDNQNIEILAAIAGGGVAVKLTDYNASLDTVINLDSSGNRTDITSRAYPSNFEYSWTADWYAYGSSGPLAEISAPLFDLANSVWTMPSGNPSGTNAATQPIARQIRVQIAAAALGYVGSQNWLDDPDPNNPAPNHCNIFVHDILKQVGLTPPDSDKSSKKRWAAYLVGLVDSQYYPAQAADWANPAKVLRGWKTVLVPAGAPAGSYPPDYSLPGDVMAEAIQYSDATGHVGIVVNNLQHQMASADSTTACDFSGLPAGLITLSDYGFRPDNYLRICHTSGGDVQLTHGQKRYAVVKRFFGQ